MVVAVVLNVGLSDDGQSRDESEWDLAVHIELRCPDRDM